MLLNVTPSLSRNDVANVRGANTKHLCDLRSTEHTRLGEVTDALHIASRKLRFPVTIAPRFMQVKEPCTSTIYHVARIVFWRPNVQVLWIHTARTVAMVKCFEVFCQRSVNHLKRISACDYSVLLDRKSTVPVFITGTNPRPAGIVSTRGIYVLPESAVSFRCEWISATLRLVVAGLATEPAIVTARGLGIKTLSTMLTNAIRGILGVRHGVTPTQSFDGAVPREPASSPRLSRASIIPRTRANIRTFWWQKGVRFA